MELQTFEGTVSLYMCTHVPRIPVDPSDEVASSFSEVFSAPTSGSSTIIVADSLLTYPSRNKVSPPPMKVINKIFKCLESYSHHIHDTYH